MSYDRPAHDSDMTNTSDYSRIDITSANVISNFQNIEAEVHHCIKILGTHIAKKIYFHCRSDRWSYCFTNSCNGHYSRDTGTCFQKVSIRFILIS